MKNDIIVSIICNTYNHEKYIADALESFISQKTNFNYEILVHDDASTDNTAKIIREYESKYPEIIKPIYQSENQYSNGGKISTRFQYPRARGKYIAICEGDDFWNDVNKLQKQVDMMENNPDVDICAHAATIINSIDGITRGKIAPSKNNCIFSLKEVIAGGGGFVATNSLMYRSSLNLHIPEFRSYLPLDYSLQIHGSMSGGMLYLKDVMSTYRYMVPGSWTLNQVSNKNAKKEFLEKINRMLDLLNYETSYKYIETIERKRSQLISDYYIGIGEYKKLLSKEFKEIYKKLSIVSKIKIRIKSYFPHLVGYIKK